MVSSASRNTVPIAAMTSSVCPAVIRTPSGKGLGWGGDRRQGRDPQRQVPRGQQVHGPPRPERLDQRVLVPQRGTDVLARRVRHAQPYRELGGRQHLRVRTGHGGDDVDGTRVLRGHGQPMPRQPPGTHLGPGDYGAHGHRLGAIPAGFCPEVRGRGRRPLGPTGAEPHHELKKAPAPRVRGAEDEVSYHDAAGGRPAGAVCGDRAVPPGARDRTSRLVPDRAGPRLRQRARRRSGSGRAGGRADQETRALPPNTRDGAKAAFGDGYQAGADDVFTGYDGGWSYAAPYVITLARGRSGITYRFASRTPLHPGVDYYLCPDSLKLCQRPHR